MAARVRPQRASVAGHFGELLQGRLGPGGPLALVTLPAPPLSVTAELRPGSFRLHSADGRWPIDRAQVAALHRALGGVPSGGLVLRTEMTAGGGAGSSTAALLAAAAVIAAAHGLPPPGAERLARLCLALEGATDPLMHPAPARLLWDPRRALVLGTLPELPALDVVGGFHGPGVRTDPGDLDFADIADLASAWGPAALRGDLATLAGLATESARRNVARRGGPDLGGLLAAAGRFGALGIVAAHTGSARGLLFAPGGGSRQACDALRALGMADVRHFRLGQPLSAR